MEHAKVDAEAAAPPPKVPTKTERRALVAAKKTLPAVVARPPRPDRQDREFLPAALEILETPPSPIGSTLLMYICGVFLCALAWAYFGKLDIYAVSPGKIQPNGQSKVVQPFNPGKVLAIHVENGSRVRAGDVLIELDSTDTGADRQAQARALESAAAEAARRKAAIASALERQGRPVAIDFPVGTGDVVKRREEDVLAADLEQLRSSAASLQAQIVEKNATKQRLSMNIENRRQLIALGKERVAMRELLSKMGAGSRAQTIESMEQYQSYLVSDAGDRGQLIETDAAIRSLQSKSEELTRQFVAAQAQKLSDAQRERDKLEQDLIKATSKHDLARLTAPIAGTVQQLAVTSIGQVVSSGQSVMTIVPSEGTMEIEAMISNRDIGFVEPGQPAVVKVEAFPFGRYGTLEGTVTKVSRDAVDERYATNLSDAANAAKPQGGISPSSQAPTLVFPATVTLKKRAMPIDGKDIPLIPGMTVTVEIKTGQRRALDYLLSPLTETVSTTAHER